MAHMDASYPVGHAFETRMRSGMNAICEAMELMSMMTMQTQKSVIPLKSPLTM